MAPSPSSFSFHRLSILMLFLAISFVSQSLDQDDDANSNGVNVEVITCVQKVDSTWEVHTNRSFIGRKIPLQFVLSKEGDYPISLDTISFIYAGIEHTVIPPWCKIARRHTWNVIADEGDRYYVQLKDYNFDGHPDVSVYNSNSGAKNRYEDIWLFDKASMSYVYNEKLSMLTNCQADSKTATITTMSIGGMASKEFKFSKYRWDQDSLITIMHVDQSHDSEHDAFIKKTQTRREMKWIIAIDTLR